MNIFGEMFYAMFGVKRYPTFLKNKTGKVILYVLVLILLYTILTQTLTVIGASKVVVDIRDELAEMPDFEIRSGKFQIEEPLYFDEDSVLVRMESEVGNYIMEYNQAYWEDMLESYEAVLLMDESSFLLKSEEEMQIYNYPENFTISRDVIYEKIDYIYIFVAICLVFGYVFSIIGYLLSALVVALIGMIICSFMRHKLTFGQIYRFSLYAKTLPLLIKGVLKLVSFNFFGYWLIAITIACVYVGFAMHQMDRLAKENQRVDGPIIF